ncbi:Sensor histidine kinase/response regulator [hydrothermal vent metagenome]|uniref:Sensor histidine kinase/response regulator n=1 Tax=hydrothermal vent metagenome TaxID=652676 RepID=A0A3B1BN47_9ZZZZ
MAITLKIETLNNYNELLSIAAKGEDSFPDTLCNFMVTEFEYQAIVLFELLDSNGFKVIGKSLNARKNYLHGSEFSCSACKLVNNPNDFSISHDSNCELQISEFVIYESCISFNIKLGERGLIKVAKKSPFDQNDTEILSDVTKYISTLLPIWFDARGNAKKTTSDSFGNAVLQIGNDLRAHSNAILGSTSILAEDNLSVSQAKYVSDIKHDAQYLVTNLKDAIELAKVENESPSYSKNINLRTLTEQVSAYVKNTLVADNPVISVDIDETIPQECNIDDIKLKYILNNLLLFSSVASKNNFAAMKINLLSVDKMQVIVSNKDTILDDNTLDTIFEPFAIYKIDQISHKGITGLSLTLSQRFVMFLGGEINVKHNSENGITFNLTIKGDFHQAPKQVDLSSLPKPTKEQNSILVIEDDYATSKLLSNYLNKWGYKPTIVSTEEQVFTQMDKEKFLSIILDIEIPNINGLQLLNKIRSHKNAKNVPVIVCSVEPDEQKAYMMGAVEYFVKPINYNYLVEVLTSYKLRKNSNILCVDDDLPTLNLIKQAIETAGFIAVAENISADVMNRIKDIQIDLAIIDLDMPHPNGFELIKLLKSEPKFAKLPIIIYTGKENFEEDLQQIDGLFEDLLQKQSVNIEDLSDTISSMINRYETPSLPEVVQEKSDDEIKILFAEDYKHSQIIVTRLLKKNGFENVVVVENGEEALKTAKNDKFDLILMDMQMPIMNGFEATGKIRDISSYKDTPIIALTAFAMKGDREKCLDAGATDYIPKPIDSKEFIEKVKFYLNASK